MQKYKVEIVEKEVYVLDIKAKDEEQASKIAKKIWDGGDLNDIKHYYSTTGGVETEVGMVFNVSGTDDGAKGQFYPLNK